MVCWSCFSAKKLNIMAHNHLIFRHTLVLSALTGGGCAWFQKGKFPCLDLELLGIEPGNFCVQSRCVTTELHPSPILLISLVSFLCHLTATRNNEHRGVHPRRGCARDGRIPTAQVTWANIPYRDFQGLTVANTVPFLMLRWGLFSLAYYPLLKTGLSAKV